MTGMEPSGPSGGKGADKPPQQKIPPAPSLQNRGEVLMEAGNIVVTFHLPEFRPTDLEFRVGTRTLSIWSKRTEVDFRTIVVLPVWVEPGRFLLTHKNG